MEADGGEQRHTMPDVEPEWKRRRGSQANTKYEYGPKAENAT